VLQSNTTAAWHECGYTRPKLQPGCYRFMLHTGSSMGCIASQLLSTTCQQELGISAQPAMHHFCSAGCCQLQIYSSGVAYLQLWSCCASRCQVGAHLVRCHCCLCRSLREAPAAASSPCGAAQHSSHVRRYIQHASDQNQARYLRFAGKGTNEVCRERNQ